jgi:hypothetical protein
VQARLSTKAPLMVMVEKRFIKRRLEVRTLILSMFLTFSFSAASAEESLKLTDGLPIDSRHNAESLKYASILPPHFGMIGQIHDMHACGMIKTPLDSQKLFLLNRPGEKNCVSVAFESARGVFLNPFDEFYYGPIPALERLTQVQAQELWGDPVTKSSAEECTFLLKSKTGTDVFIDSEFKGRKLMRYRVRSPQFSVSNWISLKGPTLPVGSPKPDVD